MTCGGFKIKSSSMLVVLLLKLNDCSCHHSIQRSLRMSVFLYYFSTKQHLWLKVEHCSGRRQKLQLKRHALFYCDAVEHIQKNSVPLSKILKCICPQNTIKMNALVRPFLTAHIWSAIHTSTNNKFCSNPWSWNDRSSCNKNWTFSTGEHFCLNPSCTLSTTSFESITVRFSNYCKMLSRNFQRSWNLNSMLCS